MQFANPLGLYALLALPVIVLIHCLQEKSRRLRVSTLFLLERIAPESASGARIERWRQSVPFWMQMLAAVLIAWMLAQPRWLKQDSTQTVVVVLDSSASMSAFRDDAKKALRSTLAEWSHQATHTSWHVIESDARKPTLYAGSQLDELLAALEKYQPIKGAHEAGDAFTTARGLLRGGDGVIMFVSDHKMELPSDIALLAVGTPTDNVGWSGVTVEAPFAWKALVTNHSGHPQTREWWIEHDKATQPTRTKLTLQPGQTLSLSGELPSDVTQATLAMAGDAFTLDDRVPMIRPVHLPVRVDMRSSSAAGKLLRMMLEAVDGVSFAKAGEPADLTVAEIGDDTPTDAILIDGPAPDTAKLDPSIVVAEHHALMDDLNWMGLLCAKPRTLAVLEGDAPLLWRNNEPLALLRATNNADGKRVRQLFLNWDLNKSNANRLPAMIVLLHRYVEQVRNQLNGERAENVETAQSLALPEVVAASPLTISSANITKPFTGTAPELPGFFTVMQGKQPVLRAAASFADAREADLTECASFDGTTVRRKEAALRATEADPLTSLWMLAVLGCLLTAWNSKPVR